MKWLKNKLRKWLGVEDNKKYCDILDQHIASLDTRTSDLVNIGVDVHFKKPHMILIYSKLKGGQLRHIDIDVKDMKDLINIVREIKSRYGTNVETWDTPPHFKNLHMY